MTETDPTATVRQLLRQALNAHVSGKVTERIMYLDPRAMQAGWGGVAWAVLRPEMLEQGRKELRRTKPQGWVRIVWDECLGLTGWEPHVLSRTMGLMLEEFAREPVARHKMRLDTDEYQLYLRKMNARIRHHNALVIQARQEAQEGKLLAGPPGQLIRGL